MHAQHAVFLDTETVGQLQQRLGHAPRNIREDHVGQAVIRPAQAARQHAKQLLRDARVLGNPVVQHLGGHHTSGDLRDAHCRGSARARVEDREFTEHVRRAHDGQQVLTSVGGVTRQLHLAGGDDVQGVALLALLEDRGSAREVDGLQLLNQSLHGFGVYPLKDSSAGQNLGVLCHLFLTLPLDDV